VYNHTNKTPTACYKMLTQDESFPRMAFIAMRDIYPGEEIFISYSRGKNRLVFSDSGTFALADGPGAAKESLDALHNRIKKIFK